MQKLPIRHACPTCNKTETLFLSGADLVCDDCSFKVSYCCPLCNAAINQTHFQEDNLGPLFNCPGCKRTIHSKRIQYLIDNRLIITNDVKCEYCQGPTVCRREVNFGNRCFFFPKCSGQGDLFGTKKDSLVFLDFETTGLEAGKDHIIEIGMLKIDEEGFEHTYENLYKPPVSIPPKITQITNITNEMVANSPTIESELDAIVDFIGTSKLVAHNTEFDIPWLLITLMKNGKQLNVKDIICTLKWAKKCQEGQASLTALSKKYKIHHVNAHRALADAVSTKELFFIFDALKKAPQPVESINNYIQTSDKIMERYRIKKPETTTVETSGVHAT